LPDSAERARNDKSGAESARRGSPAAALGADLLTPPNPGLIRSWVNFWFAPADPVGLHVIRILAGLLFIGWLLPFAGQLEAFFSVQGWFDLQAYREAARLEEMPVPIGWSVLYPFGSNPAGLQAAYWASLGILALFTLGVWTRLTGLLTWVVVASFIMSPVLSYDADYLLVILAFYLMIGYLLLGQWSGQPSLLGRILGTRETLLLRWGKRSGDAAERPGSYAANLVLRLLQVHFAVVVFISGIHKLQFGDWWSGVAFWYPLHPPMETTAEKIMAESANATTYLFFMSLAQYAVLFWQLGFPLFAWRPRWRPVVLAGAAVGWAGSALLLRQPLFGPVFLIGCLSYVTAAEWRWSGALLARLVRLPGKIRLAPALPESPVPLKTKS
jgi:hypothetical protein